MMELITSRSNAKPILEGTAFSSQWKVHNYGQREQAHHRYIYKSVACPPGALCGHTLKTR